MATRRGDIDPDRRQLLKYLGAAAAVARVPSLAARTTLTGTAINHISYSSADYKRTRDFYVGVLGFQASDEDDRQLYLWAGDGLISAKNTPAVKEPFIDHIGLTVEPWDMNVVQSALQERRLNVRVNRNDPHDPQVKTAFTGDPNRYTVQLCAKDVATRPASVASHAPLRAVALHHLVYECADYKPVRDFYTDLLGVRASNDDGMQARLSFGKAYIVVKTGAAGNARAFVERLALTIANWTTERVLAELKRHGLAGQPDATGRSVLTRDINGYQLELLP